MGIIILLVPPLFVGTHKSNFVMWLPWKQALIEHNRNVLDGRHAYLIDVLPRRVRPWSRMPVEDFVDDAGQSIPTAIVTTQPIALHTPPVSKAEHHFLVDFEQQIRVVVLPQTSCKEPIGHYDFAPVMVGEATNH